MAAKREVMAPADTAWLRMEDPTNLMMITGVLLFDEPIDFGQLTELVERRMLRFDRFRQRVSRPPLGPPVWADDPRFDIRAHMHRIALPAPGDQRALQELVSDLMSTPLDFSKPLWQFHLVEGYGSGSAVVCRLHHSIADGIALVHVLLSLTDATADPAEAGEEADERRQRRTPLEQIVTPALNAMDTTIRVTERIMNGSGDAGPTLEQELDLNKIGDSAMAGASATGKLLLMPSDPQTLFRGRLGVAKRAAWSEHIPLDLVKTIGRTIGGTVNDVVLTAVTGALRRYLLNRGSPVDGLNIRAAVPVNLRPLGAPPRLGNRFGLVFLELPIGVEEPVARLLTLRERMEEIKGSAEAVVAFGILNGMGLVPGAVQDQIVKLFGAKATAVMTNVPGPRQPIYMAGRMISDVMFWVPQSGRLGLGVSIFSYADNVLLGVATDVGLVPDPEAIIVAFQDEFATLSEMAKMIAPTPRAAVEAVA